MDIRIEIDSLGEKKVPMTAYYGIQTLRAIENFPVSGIKTHSALVRAYMQLKKAAAVANMEVGRLNPNIGHAIITACDEVLSGKFADQFVVDAFQAGAGTSFNMNCNEVLANRALELLGKQKGDYASVGPNDHVNMAQSSNDTFPTALHIALLSSLAELLPILKEFANAFFKKAEELKWRCPLCSKAIKKGVDFRIEELADVELGKHPAHRPVYKHIIPLSEIIALALGIKNAWSMKVQDMWKKFVKLFGSEINVLLYTDIKKIEEVDPLIAKYINYFRENKIKYIPTTIYIMIK